MLPLLLSTIGVFAGASYLKKKDAALASPAAPLTKQPGSTSASPGTSYPFSVPQAPRQDNLNQPWTQAARAYAGSPAGQATINQVVQGGVQGLGSLWSSMTSGSGSNGDIGDDDLGPAIDASAVDVETATEDTSADVESYGWDEGSFDDEYTSLA